MFGSFRRVETYKCAAAATKIAPPSIAASRHGLPSRLTPSTPLSHAWASPPTSKNNAICAPVRTESCPRAAWTRNGLSFDLVDDAEHVRRLDALVARIDSAAEHVFAAAERLSNEVDEAEAREVDEYGDAPRVGPGTSLRWRRLEKLNDYVDATTASVVAWTKRANDVYAERPTGPWRRWRQRRRLLWIAKYFERAAARLQTVHP
jgi:hypothetical protein